MTAPCRERRVAEVSYAARGPIDTVSAAPLSRQSAAYSRSSARVWRNAPSVSSMRLTVTPKRCVSLPATPLPQQRCSPWGSPRRTALRREMSPRVGRACRSPHGRPRVRRKRSRFIHHNGIAPCSKRYRKKYTAFFPPLKKTLTEKPLRRRNGNGGSLPV